MAPRGKWAQGIVPRNFSWVIKDQLALCERPGGYGSTHRKVRRQEEIIWLREQGFTYVVSLLGSPHNLHNYDELGIAWLHKPFGPADNAREVMERLYPEMRQLLAEGSKLVFHQAEVNDRVTGLLAGYLGWSQLVPTGPRVISIMEQIAHRPLGPLARELVAAAFELRQSSLS